MLFDNKYQILKVCSLIVFLSLRKSIQNDLARRLEREVKEILDDFSADETLKANLLKGKRVDLAEELSKFFRIQEENYREFF